MSFVRARSNIIRHSMDRLRRSLRKSFRLSSSDGRRRSGKPDSWNEDDVSVRSGTCNFAVKYLGCVEVHESRGMQICEEAMKALRASRQRPVRGVLYISGDGLRVVDSENKGLAVDQTIEKVSFCAPDRNHEKGFAYICREGTTRRWMCHGFHAVHESGERLSHAVGCAFAVCLERKQKRDREAQLLFSASVNSGAGSPVLNGGSSKAAPSNAEASSFKRGTFRYLSLRDRLCDPQTVKPAEPPPVKVAECPFAIARPHAARGLFQRQGSLRLDTTDPAATGNTFRRFNSLRLTDSGGGIVRPVQLSGPETIPEEECLPEMQHSPMQTAENGSASNILLLEQVNGVEATLPRPNVGISPSSSLSQPNMPSSSPLSRTAVGTGKGEQWLLSLSSRVKAIKSSQSTTFNEYNEDVVSAEQETFANGRPGSAGVPVAPAEAKPAVEFDPFEARWNALSPKAESTNPFLHWSPLESGS